MPAELIRANTSNEHVNVSVRWGRAPAMSTVSIGVVPIRTEDKVLFHPADDRAIAMGLNPGDAIGSPMLELDRGQINDLIRLLRRARDHAFGRDE